MGTSQEFMMALKIHGLLSSESESDSDGCEEFDDIYRKHKPPPLDEEIIRRNLVVVHPTVVDNAWEKRLEVLSKKVESLIIEDPDFPSISGLVSNIGNSSKSKVDINEPGPSSIQTSKSKSNTKELGSNSKSNTKAQSMSEKPGIKGQCSMSSLEVENSKLNQSSPMLESGRISKKKKKGKNKKLDTKVDVATSDSTLKRNVHDEPIEKTNFALQEPEWDDRDYWVGHSYHMEISDRSQSHTSNDVNENYQCTSINKIKGKKDTKSGSNLNEIPQQNTNCNKGKNSDSAMSGKKKKKLKFKPFDFSTGTPTFEVTHTQPNSQNKKRNADKYNDYSIPIPLKNQPKLLKGTISKKPHVLKNETSSPKSNKGSNQKITKVKSIPRTDGKSMTSKAETSHASKSASKKKKSTTSVSKEIQTAGKDVKKVEKSDFSKIPESKVTIPKSNSESREIPKLSLDLKAVVSHNSSKQKKKKNKNTRLLDNQQSSIQANGISRTTENGKSSELSFISGAGKANEKKTVLKANKTDNKNDRHEQTGGDEASNSVNLIVSQDPHELILRGVPNAQNIRRVCCISCGRKQANSVNFSPFSENIKEHEDEMYRKGEHNEKNILMGIVQFDIMKYIIPRRNCYLPAEITSSRVEIETNIAFFSNIIEYNDLIELNNGKNLSRSKNQLFDLDLKHWKNVRYGLESYIPVYDNIFNKFNVFLEFDASREICNYLNYRSITGLDMSYITGQIGVPPPTYHDKFRWNDGTHSSKTLSKEFEDGKSLCIPNYFVQNESTKESSSQSKTPTELDEERPLQLTITNNESNSLLVSRMNDQIALKTDLQEYSYINKKWTGCESKTTLSRPENIRANQKPFSNRSGGLKVPCSLTMIVHLIFTFICLYLIMSFMFWVVDNHLPITFLMMYLYFSFFNSDDR